MYTILFKLNNGQSELSFDLDFIPRVGDEIVLPNIGNLLQVRRVVIYVGTSHPILVWC